VGGTRQRRFDGTSLKPRELLENAATPTRRVHAVLGSLLLKDLFGFVEYRHFVFLYSCLLNIINR
jgi:hypothetical protein